MTRCNWNGSVASVWERKPRNAGTENCRKKAPPRTEVLGIIPNTKFVYSLRCRLITVGIFFIAIRFAT